MNKSVRMNTDEIERTILMGNGTGHGTHQWTDISLQTLFTNFMRYTHAKGIA